MPLIDIAIQIKFHTMAESFVLILLHNFGLLRFLNIELILADLCLFKHRNFGL